MMKSITTALSLALLLGVAACNTDPYNPNRPTDTGNMAYPTPLPQGNIGVSSPAPDTGNMALPNRAQGNSNPVRRY